MEHQLKLHIESVEDRIEELERDIEKKDKEEITPSKMKKLGEPASKDAKKEDDTGLKLK